VLRVLRVRACLQNNDDINYRSMVTKQMVQKLQDEQVDLSDPYQVR
jgi:hypothetical protein